MTQQISYFFFDIVREGSQDWFPYLVEVWGPNGEPLLAISAKI